MNVQCYMNMPSHYQEAFYRELSLVCNLHVVYSQSLSQERTDLGWESALRGYDFSFADSNSRASRASRDETVFHFLSGLPGGITNLIRALRLNSSHRFATQTELPVLSELSPLWHVVARAYIQFLKMRNIATFAIGRDARKYLLARGLDKEQVFPFAYFPSVRGKGCTRFDGPIVFIGQLVKRKGVDILLRALACCGSASQRDILIIGDGVERLTLEDLAKSLGLDNRVQFMGAQKTTAALAQLAAASCLVLPSRFDGWGVVTNEAIGLGVPVVVSSRCGASELVEQFGCGFVFESENVERLSTCLEALLSNEQEWYVRAARAREHAARISPSSGAQYFLSVVQFVQGGYSGTRPMPPWFVSPVHREVHH